MKKIFAILMTICLLAAALSITAFAAESAEEANKIIDAFVKDDPHNYCDSWGYCHVDEYEAVEGVYSEQKGIVYRGIYYTG